MLDLETKKEKMGKKKEVVEVEDTLKPSIKQNSVQRASARAFIDKGGFNSGRARCWSWFLSCSCSWSGVVVVIIDVIIDIDIDGVIIVDSRA